MPDIHLDMDNFEDFQRQILEQRRTVFNEDPEKYCLEDKMLGYKGKGLVADANNIYGGVLQEIKPDLTFDQLTLETLYPFETYEQYLANSKTEPPGLGNYLLENSDPKSVETFDKVVEEYNQLIEQAKASPDKGLTKDFMATIRGYVQTLDAIINQAQI